MNIQLNYNVPSTPNQSIQTHNHFDIRDYEGYLKPNPKNKSKYYCPVCGGNDLSINQKTGAYTCYNNDCQKDGLIIKALKELAGEEIKPANWEYHNPCPQEPLNPASVKLAKFPESYQPDQVKQNQRQDGTIERYLYYSNTQYIKRLDFPNGNKTFSYHYIDDQGKHHTGKGDLPWEAYRLEEAIQYGYDQYLLAVEGEKCAEIARQHLNIPAITWRSFNEENIKTTINQLRNTGIAGLIYFPDHDQEGYDKKKKLAEICQKSNFPCIILNPSDIYSEMPEKGDIVDWIEAQKDQMHRPDFIKRLEEAIHLAVDAKNQEAHHFYQEQNQNSILDLKTELDKILSSNLEGSDLSIALTNLAEQSRQPYRHIEQLYNQRYEEWRQAEELEQRREELTSILNNKNANIDISTIFPEPLAKPIKQMAKWLAVRPVTFATALLCGVSALHHTQSKVWLNQSWGFSVTPNLFGTMVAESSQKKSPILKTMITKPLMTLQKQWELEYQEAVENYQAELQEWKEQENPDPNEKPVEPRQRIAYFSNATPEGLAIQATKQPNQGMMYLKDELAGLFGQANKYSNGKGSDIEDLLSFYDGTGGCNLRVSGVSANYYGVLISLFGTIQPEVLRKMMGNMDDDNGLWGRFLMVNQPLSKSVMEDDAGEVNLDELIHSIYQDIDAKKSADDYTLSREAFLLFRDAYNHYEELRTAYNTKPALRAMYGKAEGRIGKIAVNLHAIKSAVDSEEDSHIIDAETMQSAIALNDFYISQILAIHGELDDEVGLSGLLAKIVQIANKANKPISASEVSRSLTKRERKPVKEIKQHFHELEQLGYGMISGTNRSLKFELVSKLTDAPTAKKQSKSELQTSDTSQVGKVGTQLADAPTLKNSQREDCNEKLAKLVDNDDFFNSDQCSNPNDIEEQQKLAEKPTDSQLDQFCQLSNSNADTEENTKVDTSANSEPISSQLSGSESDRMKTEANQQGIKEDSKPWGTKNDLPPDEIEKLVINYLKEHGESEEWEIIVCVGQKTPNVRAALNNVAKITRTERIDATTKTNYWNIKDEGEDIW